MVNVCTSQLINYDYYGPFEEFAKNGTMTIYPRTITSNNIDIYREGLLNIFKDGIETDEVKSGRVRLDWGNGIGCTLSLHDTLYNLVMWKMLCDLGQEIQPYNLFYAKNISADTIKDYIDENIVTRYVSKIDGIKLNRIIYNGFKHLMDIDQFAWYLGNTFDLWDFIEMMLKNPKVKEIMEAEYDVNSIEDAQEVGEAATKKFLKIIDEEGKASLGRDFCCANAYRAQSGLSMRQFKELAIHVGTKPDGLGSIYPYSINSNFLNKGLNSLEAMFVETASAGRYAQIIAKGNVASSGAFARVLGLNNCDTFLNDDPNYDCNTKNFVQITVTSEKMFKRLLGRYYRETENSDDHIIRPWHKKKLLGKTILLRDPITCQSKANGFGICYKCYGELAHTTKDINIGKIAAELLSSILTQKLLSAKHLLTAKVIKIVFGDLFSEYFTNEEMMITLRDDRPSTHAYIKINTNNVESDSDDEDDDEEQAALNMTDYVTEFILEIDGVDYPMSSENNDNLYITPDFNKILNSARTDEDGIKKVALSSLEDIQIFQLPLLNNELVKTLNDVKHIINLTKVTSSFTKDEILQRFLECLILGGLNIHSSHASVILSNLFRMKTDILETPDWSVPNQTNYQILPLSAALVNNPSVSVTLQYQGIARTLVAPITFKKRKPSRLDMYFMKQPQVFLKDEHDSYVERKENGMIRPFGFKSTTASFKEKEAAMQRRIQRELKAEENDSRM